jgi:hypothetical protein
MIIRVFALALLSFVSADDPIFSGPQPGEALPAFKMRGVFDVEAGQEIDLVAKANGGPMVLVFVHDTNRPSIAMTRALLNYAASRGKDGLHAGAVWLSADMAEAEAALKRMRQALPKGVAIGISPDGKEGPGRYGLNRNVTLTILVARENKVTANFALVQPSIQADLPKVLDAIVKVAGGKAPKLEDMPEVQAMLRQQPPGNDEKVTGLFRKLIQKTAKPEEVDKIAAEIDEYIKKNEAARKDTARRSKVLVEGGKLADYGTPRAQEHIRKWAKELNPPAPGAKP